MRCRTGHHRLRWAGGLRDPRPDSRRHPVEDPEALLAGVHGLLGDEETRVARARAGHATATTFTWDRSATIMEQFFEAYLADPAAFVDRR